MADYNSDRTGSNIDLTLDKVDALVDSGNNVTADGLTVEKDGPVITFKDTSGGNNTDFAIQGNGGILTLTNDDTDAKLARFSGTGNVEFYEDTGTTAKMVWSSSAESLGICTTSLTDSTLIREMHINSPVTNGVSRIRLSASSENQEAMIAMSGYLDANSLVFSLGGGGDGSATERMRIDSAGNVGIGTSVLTNNSLITEAHIDNPSTNGVSRLRLSASGESMEGAIEMTGYLGSDSLTFSVGSGGDGSATERMRINSAGNVGIGTASPSGALTISGNFESNKAIVLDNTQGTGKTSYIRSHGLNGDSLTLYHDGNQMQSWSSDGTIAFKSAGTERARIDGSGNLLVGTTDTTLFNAATGGGILLDPNGPTTIARENVNGTLILNKTGGNEGLILELRKDGAPVGSIGTVGADLTIGTGNTGMRFRDEFSVIQPHNTATNGTEDGVLSLGKDGARFKDLYLSGGVYLGGTGAVNKLDDYEEGVWTPTYGGATTIGTGTYAFQEGKYTKVGNLVTLSGYFRSTTHTGTGAIQLLDLPFTAESGNGNYAALVIGESLNLTKSIDTVVCGYVIPGTDRIQMRQITTSSTTSTSSIEMDTGFDLLFSITYRTI